MYVYWGGRLLVFVVIFLECEFFFGKWIEEFWIDVDFVFEGFGFVLCFVGYWDELYDWFFVVGDYDVFVC